MSPVPGLKTAGGDPPPALPFGPARKPPAAAQPEAHVTHSTAYGIAFKRALAIRRPHSAHVP